MNTDDMHEPGGDLHHNGNGHAGGRAHNPREEILERTWRLREEGAATLPRLLEQVPWAEPQVQRLIEHGLLTLAGAALGLTPEGEREARHVVRANGLAARLLADVLELPRDVIELHACRLEHAIGPALADSLCAFLGHPPTTPDGRPIPAGACCQAPRREVEPAVIPLNRAALGDAYRVIFIQSTDPARPSQLSALGLTPGMALRFRQRRPSVVVEVGESTLALDDSVAREIFVKPL